MSGGAWFRQAVELAWRHPKVLLPWIPVLVLNIFATLLQGYLRALLLFAVVSWAVATTLFFLEQVAQGKHPSLDEATRRGLGRLPSMVGLELVILVLICLLTVAPAAVAYAFLREHWVALILLWLLLFLVLKFLLVRLALAGAALILGGAAILDALAESWSTTHAVFLPILGLLLRVALLGVFATLLGRHVPWIGPLFEGLGDTAGAYLATAGLGYAYLALLPAEETGSSSAMSTSPE